MQTTSDVKVDLQPAFVLHQRPYRDSSAIFELFTRDWGRVSLLARGIKRSGKGITGSLQPFSFIHISWQGRGELKNFNTVEQKQSPLELGGDYLISAFYINELLLRLLPKLDPYTDLFYFYADVLQRLSAQENLEIQLRLFEKRLLAELGYELNLVVDAKSGTPIEPQSHYFFLPEQGPIKSSLAQTGQQQGFSGKSLIAFDAEDFTDVSSLKDAKRITRLALKPLLGNRPLKSREVFASFKKQQRVD